VAARRPVRPGPAGDIPAPSRSARDKCEAARGIKENFGAENALKYIIGEKFLDYLGVAELACASG
jgi:hypothetical protein